jgi:hypothetical protein
VTKLASHANSRVLGIDCATDAKYVGLAPCIESDWHRGVAYVGMSRARTRLHVIIHEDCDKKRREREEEWRERVDSDVEMLL